MDFDQNGIIEKTRRALTPFSFLKTIAMIVIYVGVVILFFIVLKIDLDPYVIGAIVVILSVYFLSKDMLLSSHYRKMMTKQRASLDAKLHREFIYVPLIGKNGSLTHLKQASLVLVDGELSLEVFEHRAPRQGNLDGVSVPLGPDFVIREISQDPKMPIYCCLSEVKGIDFRFCLIADEQLINLISNELKPLEKEVT